MNYKLWPLPTVRMANTGEVYEQMEDDEFDDEINDKGIVLELLKFSTISLLYMTEDIQKDIAFYTRAVKLNGNSIALDFLDVCAKKIVLEAINDRIRFRFFICR